MDQVSFIEIFFHQLKMSIVHEDEKITVLTQANEEIGYADAFMAAGQLLGANMYHTRLPPPLPTGGWNVGASGLASMPDAVKVLKNCDMLIDRIFLLFSPEQMAIKAAGTRILTVVEPPELLTRMLPNQELKEKVEIAGELLSKAREMRITSEHGTDVTYKLKTYPTVTEYACTDEPGRWDHWPSGFVFTGGDDDGVDGQIVVAPGDILLPQNIYVREPITYTIEKGWITNIRGGLDADIVTSYMQDFNDERGFGMSHVGCGMNRDAKWHRMVPGKFSGGTGMEPRSFYGNVMFSTGPNSELGGSNDTACHLDVPMRNCSLFLDDNAIVIDGNIVEKDVKISGLEKPTLTLGYLLLSMLRVALRLLGITHSAILLSYYPLAIIQASLHTKFSSRGIEIILLVLLKITHILCEPQRKLRNLIRTPLPPWDCLPLL